MKKHGCNNRAILSICFAIIMASPVKAATEVDADALKNPACCAFTFHSLTALVDPVTATLRATDRIRLATGEGFTGKIPFLLNRNLEISAVAATLSGSGEPIVVNYQINDRWNPRDFWANPEYGELTGMDHARQINLFLTNPRENQPWPAKITLTIVFEGVVYDSLQAPPENYQRGFATSSGLIDERGTFLASSTLWYPERYDGPFTFQLNAGVPESWQAISQGRSAPGAVSPDWPPATASHHWISDKPMDEIYLIAGPYVLREIDHEGVLVQTYTYGNDDAEMCENYLSATCDYLDLYSDLIGAYPFAKFALVENFWQTGYGMPSFTLLGDKVVRLPWIVKTSYGHEILHNWWGNGVFVDWESGNWCEGLTVYGADYLYKEQESQAAARDYRRTSLQGYLDYVGEKRDFALTEFRSRHDASTAAVGYNKSMMVYHMLRRLHGDEQFWNSLSTFYRKYLFKRATWTDLLAEFPLLAGDAGSHFYDQWIARSGAPVLRLSEAFITAEEGEGWRLTYTLNQEVDGYALDIPVRIFYGTRDPEDLTISLTSKRRTLSEVHTDRPVAIAVDPDFDLFRRLHREEVPTALSQLFGADSLAMVLGTNETDPLKAACHVIAENSKKAKPTGVYQDDQISPTDLSGSSSWFLGAPRWLVHTRQMLPPQVKVFSDGFEIEGQHYSRDTHSLVFAMPHPDATDHAVGVLLASDPESVRGIWRKLPHYGKYSYLVFEGTRNVAKGSWEIVQSPLKVIL
jgi:Peptidase family M1 domain